jgi:Zn-dependent protease with chaperone function
MDFFGDQQKAKRRTGRLVFLFVLAVVGIIFSVYFSLASAFALTDLVPESYWATLGPFPFWNPTLFAWTSGGVLLLIGAGSATKYIGLMGGGGERVAQMFPGGFLHGYSAQPKEKMLINIVEEMSIASGEPVPRIYLVDSDEINAFVAGVGPGDAVLGVTRGCLDSLDREELQGVVAHEFSHLLNGDMGFSLRLIGILHGILLINIVGQIIFRSIAGGRGRGDAKIAALVFGFSLMVIGWIGVFFGKIIKAAVSRQREFLADAAAVQFTRNPSGITRALMKIRKQRPEEAMGKVESEEVSHLLLSHGEGGHFLSSHPPLSDRIRRLDPRGQIAIDKKESISPPSSNAFASGRNSSFDTGADPSEMAGVIALNSGGSGPSGFSGAITVGEGRSTGNQVNALGAGLQTCAAGSPGEESRRGVVALSDPFSGYPADILKRKDVVIAGTREWLGRVDPLVLKAARDPREAGWLLLLLTRLDFESIGDQDNSYSEEEAARVNHLRERIKGLQIEDVLPVCDIALSTLKSLPPSDLRKLSNFAGKAESGGRAEDGADLLLQYLLKTFLRSRIEDSLNPIAGRDPYGGDIGRHFNSARVIMSALARNGGRGAEEVRNSYHAGISAVVEKTGAKGDHLLKNRAITSGIVDENYSGWSEIDRAIFSFKNTSPTLKAGLLDGCLACISHDGMVTREEAVLYRAFAGVLNCPVPPIFPESKGGSSV